MDLSDDEVQRRAEADRREVDPPIQVETATWSNTSSGVGPSLGRVGAEKVQLLAGFIRCHSDLRESRGLRWFRRTLESKSSTDGVAEPRCCAAAILNPSVSGRARGLARRGHATALLDGLNTAARGRRRR